MGLDKKLEASIGLFDVALSFSADGVDSALALSSFAEFYGLKCYEYQRYAVSQSGLSIWDAMEYAFSTSRLVVVLNTPLYGQSAATKFELGVIRRRAVDSRVIVIDLDGRSLCLPGQHVEHYSELSDDTAVSIMTSIS